MEQAIFAGAMCTMFALCVFGWYLERRQWNKGTCAITGKAWVQYDTDSGGGKLFTDYCGNYMAVSWPMVIRKSEEVQRDGAT